MNKQVAPAAEAVDARKIILSDGSEADAVDVFISYDHELAWRTGDDLARRVADALEAEGYTVWWDRGLLDQGMTAGEWPEQLQRQAERARCVVSLETVRYFTRPWCLNEFEAGLEAGKLARFQIEKCAPSEDFTAKLSAALKERLDGRHYFSVENLGEATGDFVVNRLKQALEPSRPKPADKALSNADISALPPVLGGLVGRTRELDQLREAWAGGSVNVAVLHAPGGAGKTAIMRRFAYDLLDYDADLTRAYAWSAYSQGTNKASFTDADGFIAAALKWFGGEPRDYTNAVDQADALADIAAQEKALLLLDGLEPLQSAPHVKQGRLQSKSLARLITRLADFNKGLLVLTSRQDMPELSNRAAVRRLPLQRLSEGDGVALLRRQGGYGARKALQTAVGKVSGHALSVRLLGAFASRVCGGDVAKAEEMLRFAPLGDLSDLTPDEQTNRMAYRSEKIAEQTLARLGELEDSRGEGKAERVLLHLLGLFDRPADGAAAQALLKGPAIPGLTDPLFVELGLGEDGLTEAALSDQKRHGRWHWAKVRLRELGLLAAEDPSDKHGLDAHPVIRRYFRERLEKEDPEAWRLANDRLYRHYAAAAQDLPGDLKAMQPLLHAIPHAVAAGHVQEAFDEIYYRRLRRGGDAYINKQLGAFDATLSVLAAFFDAPWSAPRSELTETDQSVALNFAASALRAVGRLADAVAPFQEASRRFDEHGHSENAAKDAGNASELLLTIGRIAEAREWAGKAQKHAEQSGELFRRMVATTQAGDAAHAAGDLGAAAALFAKAEALQAEHQPGLPRLYSLRGYRQGDLMLSQGRPQAARELYLLWVKWRMDGDSLLDRGLEELLAARAGAALLRAAGATQTTPAAPTLSLLSRFFGGKPTAPEPGPAEPAETAEQVSARLDAAIAALIKAASDHHVPRGYIARAAFCRWRAGREPDKREEHKRQAAKDLDLAFEIADYGGMGLFLADIALERAALALLDGGKATARQELEEAERIIVKTGYGRRQALLNDLKREAA